MKKAFQFIDRERKQFPVKVLAEVLGVNRQAYYAWVKRPPSRREVEDRKLTGLIKEIHSENRQVYGVPRIHAELRLIHQVRISSKRVARLMREARISGLIPKRRGKTTIKVPGVRVADDLINRNFAATAPDQAWVADITYLFTGEGTVYLAAIQDLFSRRIVGWAMDNNMRAGLVIDALKMAVHQRQPEAGLIHHSDQGSQYVSLAFGQLAKAEGIARSMGAVGTAYDNAVAESFFSTLKRELIHRRSWPNRAELRSEVFSFIEGFYNRKRRHSYLGWISPAEYEDQASLVLHKNEG